MNDLKKLEKDTVNQKFVLAPFIEESKAIDANYLKSVQYDLFHNLPFYEGLLFNKESGSVRSAIYMNKALVNTAERKTFILNDLVPKIDKFEKETGIDLKVSGMPYIRTINADNMKGEIGLFIGASLLTVSLIFFSSSVRSEPLLFRSAS